MNKNKINTSDPTIQSTSILENIFDHQKPNMTLKSV